MLSYIESLFVVLFCVAVVLGMARFVNRAFDDGVRKRANGVNGWQLSILGSIYAVALGFMLSDAWLAYQTADRDVRDEAAAALNIYRTATLLPVSCALPLRSSAEMYIRTVEDVEWPSMGKHTPDFRAESIVRNMWGIINSCDVASTASAHESVIRALEALQVRRDARMEDYQGRLPFMMWAVLVFGAAAVIASSCLLGNEKQMVHNFHLISLTVLISVTLLAISDLDRPFDGSTYIHPSAFQRVLAEINNPAAQKLPSSGTR